jgi:Ca-activated chloride channel family protein
MWDWLSLEWFTLAKLQAFSWAHPYYLYGVLAIPVAFWLRNAFQAGAFQQLGVTFVDKDAPRSWSVAFRYLFPLTGFLALSCLLIALARPQLINTVTERDAEVVDIMLALDISDSMLEQDLPPNRLSSAKSVAFTLCPLTNDYELIYNFLENVDHRMITVAGTAVGSALAVCINRLRESMTKSKVVVVLSDGDNTAGNLDPTTAAKLAKAFGIRVYTIAVGKPFMTRTVRDSLGTSKVVNSLADEAILKQIAATTNGQFYRATDNTTLTHVFRQIDRLERVNVKNRRYQEVKDYYRIYLNWAITFFLTLLFLKVTFIANVLED